MLEKFDDNETVCVVSLGYLSITIVMRMKYAVDRPEGLASKELCSFFQHSKRAPVSIIKRRHGVENN